MSEIKRSAFAGVRSIANLLLTAIQPVGNTMYVWGGGWNEEDNGAGIEARSIGVSPRWKAFADRQDAQYDFEKTRYQIHDGLDCSGYVGWVIYNVFEKESGNAGYVMPASYMAWELAGSGWGRYTPAEQMTNWQAGDIMSAKGHVWIVLGMCEDGSVVFLHSSPPGVTICGTASPRETGNCGTEAPRGTAQEGILGSGAQRRSSAVAATAPSQAVMLAEKYMRRFYPQWYARYPDCSKSASYLKKSSRMRWHRDVLTDQEALTGKSAAEVLAWLFPEK